MINICLEYYKAANYSLINNRIPICQSLELSNTSKTPIKNITVVCEGEYIKTYTSGIILQINAGESVRVSDFEIVPDAEKVLELTERLITNFKVCVLSDGISISEQEFELELMAYDQWLGNSILPQSIVSFITPNHPDIKAIIVKAASILKDITGSSQFTEYQSGNTNDVRQQVAAVYAALHQLGIVYRAMPANYSEVGQRVTMPDQVISGKLGNCIELTLLFASILESIGINCGIVFQKGHAYLAVWLVDDCCSYSICDDASFIEKKCSRGIDEMLVIESTMVTKEKTSFEDAVKTAEQNLADHSKFEMMIDVLRCRLERFFPLPIRIKTDGRWEVVSDGVDHDVCITNVKEHDRFDLTNISESKRELSKMDIWERKLLDFSLRNSLLNLYLRRKAIQFISFDIDRIEDHLADGEEYNILSKPNSEFKIESEDRLIKSKLAEPLRNLITNDIEHHKLHTFQTETETNATLKNIYRAARNAIEETGANSLFLTIGTLRWYETPKSETPRFAPILLLPVEMVYKKGGYYIRTRDEEATLNITLIEFLKQNYDIKINGLDILPKDEHGVDVPLIFAILRDALKEQKRWDVEEECLLGTFSFSKFLMWNDIHNHRDEMLQNKVVDSLVNNRLAWSPEPINKDLKDIDGKVAPTELALPVAVDSSQMAAIIEAGEGHSFILYGPPGTGKSQTITNLIANALFQGKSVLFVAEKMAALSVVENRLTKIGLEPFCLEMHSNKVAKKHILEQLDKALKVTHIVPPSDYQKKADKIFSQRKEMIEYLNALHNTDSSDGLSLYDCIIRYESIEQQPLQEFEQNPRLDAVLAQNGVSDIEEILGNKLDTILKLVGQPSCNPLAGLHISNANYTPDQLHTELKEALIIVEECLKDFGDLESIKKLKESILRDNNAEILDIDEKALYNEWRSIKAKWFLPKFFAKKTFVKKMKVYNQYITADEIDPLINNLIDFKAKHNRVEALRKVLLEHLCIKTPMDEMPAFELLTNAVQKIKGWIGHKDYMRDWIHWCNYRSELLGLGLDCIVDALEKRPNSSVNIKQSFFKALYKSKAQKKMDAVPLIANFEGMIFDDKVKSYVQYTEEYQLLTQKELYARLAARIPRVGDNIDNNSEIGLLKRNISNGGRGLSLRDLLDQIPTLLPRLCPCMLMSPMSVAQYLDLSQDKFDIVIFDEASQMPTSEAVGAIARGNALVVVGDPKQMPPTSFFTSTNVDEEEAAIDDMESILEDCRTLELPSLQLNWHYRSRHESLIAFSNNEYYDGSLITFPSVDDQTSKVGYVPVEGYYDKGGKRSNKAEAEAIVNEIERRLKDEKLCKMSIGVIAFSVVQQGLIEDILQDRMDADRELKELADSMYEPIFVKNLENVQGDERDVILFSIGYGPNQEGKVSMNFGPLNNSGGERRLNVAVSRARCEMIVYSTLKSSQIDLRRSKARGVEGLKHFLEYAETQTLIKSDSNTKVYSDSVIAEQIAEALNNEGYLANVNVGRSMFKVDVAVSDKNSPDVYLLGILLDGEGYRDTQTTRDREIVQPSVLRGLKWNVMRVWSVDWFNNPQRVLSRILENLEKTKEPVCEEPVAIKNAFDISMEQVEEIPSNEIEYKEYNPGNRKDFGSNDFISDIIKVEQPITLMHLARKVSSLKGYPRVTPTLLEEVEKYVKFKHYTVPDVRGGLTIWTNQQSSINYELYRQASGRDIMDIPMIEIKNAVKEAISEQFAISVDSLSLISAKKLGFTRRGTKVESSIQEALNMLKSEHIVIEEEGKLKLIN